jgi:mitochondrial enoyl-[acyl-carrier protein] reductase / trans-2-enoyl-CoA reductase
MWLLTMHSPVACSDNMNVLGLYPVPTSDGVIGYEGVGEVMATGPDVTLLKKGDRVVPLGARTGTWRDYIVSEEADWHIVWPDISLADAATLVVNPPTALLMLESVDLKEGDVVIQNGANSEARRCRLRGGTCT